MKSEIESAEADFNYHRNQYLKGLISEEKKAVQVNRITSYLLEVTSGKVIVDDSQEENKEK